MDGLRSGSGVSTMSPLGTTVSLLVTFGKVRYPSYSIHVTEKLFRSQKEFRRWEAANELHYLLQLSQHRDVSPSWPFIAECLQEMDISDKALERDIDPSSNHLLQRLIFDSSGICTFQCMLTLIMLSLAQQLQSVDVDPSRPEFLSMLDPGHILVGACHGHIGTLEKEPFKDYELAVLLLRLLLSGHYTPSRRAKWYRRLVINLDVHLKNIPLAAYCLNTALKDPFVKVCASIVELYLL